MEAPGGDAPEEEVCSVQPDEPEHGNNVAVHSAMLRALEAAHEHALCELRQKYAEIRLLMMTTTAARDGKVQ